MLFGMEEFRSFQVLKTSKSFYTQDFCRRLFYNTNYFFTFCFVFDKNRKNPRKKFENKFPLKSQKKKEKNTVLNKNKKCVILKIEQKQKKKKRRK